MYITPCPKLKFIDRLRRLLPELIQQFGVKRLALFGSVARSEATIASDIDILVEFDHPSTYMNYIHLRYRLEDALGKPVDLVPADGLKAWVKPYIEPDLQFIGC